MDNLKCNRVLVLGPHTDDGEFGCGALMAKFAKEGRDIHYVAFSACEESVPAGMPKDILRREIYDATSQLGLSPSQVDALDFKVRNFPHARQEILEKMVQIRSQYEPDLVLLPSQHDIHQDHRTIYEEGLRAFKFCSILGYEMPWNNLTMTTNAFVRFGENELEKKIASLSCYQSQINAGRHYASREFIEALSRTRGVQVKSLYAEAFQVIRWIVS